MRYLKFIVLGVVLSCSLPLFAKVAYQSANVRFTLIDEGTVRLEYAPDGKFVDNKSFMAVIREYPDVPYTIKDNSKQVVITTAKLKLVYKKGTGPLSADNLTISSTKAISTPFVWKPGTPQKGNLKGTYRTLDGYDGAEYQYANPKHDMPIEDGILATDGWTFIDDSKRLLFDGDKDWEWVTERKSAEGAQDWYFMAYGHDYKSALLSYTKFAGKVPLPPRYAFGYWWSRYWSYSDQDFRNLIAGFRQLDLPLDVLVIDMDWHPISPEVGGGWTGWDWNERLFPDYKKFLKYLDEQGVKATMNLHPADGVRPYEKKYKEFMQRLGKDDGKTYEWLGSDKRYVKALFDTYLHPYMDEGVDFWWLDWQQWEKDRAIKSLDNVFWCNYIWFSDMEHNGQKRPMLYHRWGGLGNHRYQIGFSGDSYITWKSLKFLPYFNATASNVLYGYWSHDIGGHQSLKHGTPVEPQLYTRAMQMGQYLPIIRSHSTKDPSLNKEPWAFDQTTQQRLVNVINGRYALVPYIYTMARRTYETGISLCRPLYYDSPEAKEAYEYNEEYMFGDNMLIAPITDEVDKESGYATVKLWLPAGEWLEYETGEMLHGGKTYERSFTMDEYPVYVKAGSILPYYGKLKNLSGTEQAVTVRVFPGQDKGEFQLYEDNGEDKNYVTEYAVTPLSYVRQDGKLKVTIGARTGQYKDMPAQRRYSVALPCQKAPLSVTSQGKQLPFTYDGMNLETTIDLGMVNCATGTDIEIEMPQESSLTDGLKAQFRHIQTVVHDFKQHEAGMVYTEDFGFLEAAPLRLSYHPEKQDETLSTFREKYQRISQVLIGQMGIADNYQRAVQLLNTKNVLADVDATAFQANGKTGFSIRFFNNKTLTGNAVATAHFEKMDAFWSQNPCDGVTADGWSLIAESEFTTPEAGEFIFHIAGDDGYRLFVDGKQLCADWGDHSETSRIATLKTTKDQKHSIRIEYYDNEYNGNLRLKVMTVK
jgi:alpha-glucosidase (family GH31 glycosyl hydrolase)